MRISDWSSDVCSSDLRHEQLVAAGIHQPQAVVRGATDLQGLQADILADAVLGVHDIVARLERAHLLEELLDAPAPAARRACHARSAERRVGKECVSPCRLRWSPYHLKKTKTPNDKPHAILNYI